MGGGNTVAIKLMTIPVIESKHIEGRLADRAVGEVI